MINETKCNNWQTQNCPADDCEGLCAVLRLNSAAGSRPVDDMVMRAFLTEAIGAKSIVFAETASQARYDTVRDANDAGFEISFQDVRVLRAPEFDCRETVYGMVPTSRKCLNATDLRSA